MCPNARTRRSIQLTGIVFYPEFDTCSSRVSIREADDIRLGCHAKLTLTMKTTVLGVKSTYCPVLTH